MAETAQSVVRQADGSQLPAVFQQEINKEFLKRAYLSEESERFQLKYTDPLAGKRKSAELTKRRRSYKTTYGHTMNRSPRKTLLHRGTSFFYVGAVAPHTVGGREAHPPKAERVMVKKLNKKEKVLAIRMGIAGSANKEMVSRFHLVKDINSLPVTVDDKINSLSKTKEAIAALNELGLSDELKRITERKIRAGKGKLRGRKYKRKLGPVLVTTDDSKVARAMANLNITVRRPGSLNIYDVTHAGNAGRLMIWTKGALASLG